MDNLTICGAGTEGLDPNCSEEWDIDERDYPEAWGEDEELEPDYDQDPSPFFYYC